MATVFLRLLAHDDKPAALAQALDRLRDGEPSPDVHVVDPESFRQVPGSPFAYWAGQSLLASLAALKILSARPRGQVDRSDGFVMLRQGGLRGVNRPPRRGR